MPSVESPSITRCSYRSHACEATLSSVGATPSTSTGRCNPSPAPTSPQPLKNGNRHSTKLSATPPTGGKNATCNCAAHSCQATTPAKVTMQNQDVYYGRPSQKNPHPSTASYTALPAHMWLPAAGVQPASSAPCSDSRHPAFYCVHQHFTPENSFLGRFFVSL